MKRWVIAPVLVILLFVATGTFHAQPTGYVTLSWSDPAPVALPTLTGFAVYKLHNGVPVLIGTVAPDVRKVTINKLPMGEPHTFLMKTLDRVKGASGFSEPVTSVAFAQGTLAPPGKPILKQPNWTVVRRQITVLPRDAQ